ncbi:zinc finger protein 770-like [Oncorhynchus masou masou]|uniref:zinc finger protein 770-like n=1 Tax=Oncorhynchus masou masou TaxID=90313 RepID=UPI0031831ECD
MHQCSVCCKGFPSASKLQRHYLIHTGQKPFTCLVCGKAFRQSVHLKKHSETHTANYHNWSPPTDSLQHTIPVPINPDPSLEKSGHDLITDTPLLPAAYFQRDGTMERTPPELYTTASEIKPQLELISPADNGLFSSQQNTQPGGHFFTDLLHDNMIVSDGMENSAWHTDDVYTCTVCLMCFSSPHQLQRHLPVHSQPKPFECNICGKAFRLRAHLKMHSQIHERRPTGFSKTIPILGSQQSSFRGRMRVNHECPTCSKTFCSPSKLKRHFLTHTGQKPFSCEDCGKTFRQVSHLKTHLYASHNKSNLQNVCTKQKEKQIDARNTNVDMELQCEISVGASQHLDKLEKSSLPVKVEPNASGTSQFECSICSKTFSSSIRHRQHYMMHKEVRPFQCRVCGRTFRLSIHLKRHQVSHKNQDEYQNTSQVDDPRGAVSVSKTEHAYQNSDKGMTSPESNESKALELNIIVKPEHWKLNVKDDKDFPVSTLPEPESTAKSHLKTPVFGQTSSQCKISQKAKNQQLNHQCLACLKCFPSPSKLQRHMLTHTGQRPFGCHTCGKRFRQPTHLRIHSHTHLWSKNGKQRNAPRSRPPSLRITEHRESPVGVQFQEKLPENHNSDGNVHLKSPTEKQSGQGSTFACGHNESNRKMHWFQHSTSSLSKPQLPLQMPPETTLNQSGHLQLKNQAMPSTGKVSDAPFLSTGPELALKGADAISVGSTSHTKHQCLLCFKYFPSSSKLQRHNLVHTGLRPFQCLACGKTFRQATHLKVHEGTHKWRPFRPASRQGNRMKVRRPQQLQYPKVCVQVPVTSSMKAETFHSNGVNEWRPFQDNFEDTCSNQPKAQQDNNINSTSKQSIPNKVTCAKRKSHLCTICQKGFDTPSKLSRHFLIHTGIRPFKCSLCTKTFRQPCHLRSHERRTHEIKTCSDVQDNSTFQDPDHETLASAHGNKLRDMPQSYKDSSDHCSVTDEGLGHSSEARDPSFVAIQDISLPNDNMESGSRQSEDYWCTECHSNFLSPSELATHLIVHRHALNNEMTGHNSLQQEMGGHMHSMQMEFQTNQVIADADSHNVIQNERLDHYWREPIHMSFQCDKCITSFETERDLQLHKCASRNQIEVTQSSTYRCAICFKDFKTPSKLQRHYVTHTGERPFQCKVCEKTFTQASHLKTHQRTHKSDKD